MSSAGDSQYYIISAGESLRPKAVKVTLGGAKMGTALLDPSEVH